MTITSSTSTTVRIATDDDRPHVARIIARAFQDDPVMCWITPDPVRRAAIAPAVFDLYASAYIPLGATHITGDRSGAALWAPPGTQPVPEEDAEAFGEKVVEVAGEDAERLFELEATFEAHVPATPHFHLQLFGTLPERQGQGIGSSMLVPMLAHCDQDGIPCYLEATSPANRRLYERHGFVATGDITPTGGPTLTAMWRDPAEVRH